MPDRIDAKEIGYFSKMPFDSKNYMDMRGVVDFGNLAQFAPYESGYCFLAVINAPYCMSSSIKTDMTKVANYNGALQDAFVKVLEQEFRGLDGIEDITSETMDITDNISTMSLISKTTQATNGQVSMRFTEKAGSLITKYISTYLRTIKDPKSQAKTYGGIINKSNVDELNPGPHMEVFNMLYIVTDATCLRVEKAFLILNAQPTTANFADLYSTEKGEIGTKELSVTFNAFVVDGNIADKLGYEYVKTLVNTTDEIKDGKINVNSWNYNWSFANGTGDIKKVGNLNVAGSNGTSTDKNKFIEATIENGEQNTNKDSQLVGDDGYVTSQITVGGTKTTTAATTTA